MKCKCHMHEAVCSYCGGMFVMNVIVNLEGTNMKLVECPECGEILGCLKGEPGFSLVNIIKLSAAQG